MARAPTSLDCAGVLLAGGDSTRFSGGDKALADLGGVPLLARAAAALRAATGRPPVVAPRERGRLDDYRSVLPSDVSFVDDAPAFKGPLAGVVGAARAVGEAWLFVAACDMPRLSPAAVAWLAERASDSDAAVVDDGTVQPVHACYRRAAVLDAAPALPASGGLRALVDALPRVTRLSPADADDVPLRLSLANVNTRADLRDLCPTDAGGSAGRR